MSDHQPVFRAMAAWNDSPMALATVIETWGSAPRPIGSHMLLRADGSFEGSVSGGCVESETLAICANVMRSGRAELNRYGVADRDAWKVGLPCGGTIGVLVQRVGTDGFPLEIGAEVRVAAAERRPVVVATDLETGRSWLAGDLVGSPLFVNRYAPPFRLLVVGAVQIAQTLTCLAATLGFEVTVIDPRPRFLTTERFPGVQLDERWPDEAIAAARPDPSTAVVTLSHDIKLDDPALLAAMAAPTGYIAALGSTRSHAARRERLLVAGATSEAIDRVEGPAGVPINAVGAAEIALSIASGIVRALRAVERNPSRKETIA